MDEQSATSVEELLRSVELDPSALHAVERRWRAAGAWERSVWPTDEQLWIAGESAIHAFIDDPAVAGQVTRTDVVTEIDEVVVTAYCSGEIEVAAAGLAWMGVVRALPCRISRGAIRVPVDRSPRERSVMLADAVVLLRARRRRSWRTCGTCRQRTEPARWLPGGYCHSCAERYHGVVF